MARRSGPCSAAFLQGGDQIEASRSERRPEPEKQSGAQRSEQREKQDAVVKFHGFKLHQVRKMGLGEDRASEFGEGQACEATQKREQQGFREQSANESGTAGPQGGAHGKLPLARCVPRQEQIGKIDAGDEQNHADRAEEQQQHGTEGADARIGQGANRHGNAVVHRVGSGKPLGDGVQIRLRLFEGHALLQAAQRTCLLGAARGLRPDAGQRKGCPNVYAARFCPTGNGIGQDGDDSVQLVVDADFAA